MSNRTREHAISAIAEYDDKNEFKSESVSEIKANYGSDVFSLDLMRTLLPKQCFAKLEATIREGAELDPAIAEDVAQAMKTWALSKGATHYTHWFQPLTGTTAEKHDSFFSQTPDGKLLVEFSGKNLIVGESDASSFPSGGLRSTFEARGYTAWDPTSPAFIRHGLNGATLCIPTAFCSYTGEALDKKTPLLRSIQVISRSVKRLMKAFGAAKKGASVTISLGAEQEYFLIDRHFYYSRPDLIQTGRTLFGAPPPKHQQLEDHYYGAIRPRILAYMNEVEHELWRLGIPAKTRHNEAAPAQFEIAPLYEDLNLAVDHNMIIMEVLRLTAEKHDLVCLLHEKPFAGVNGSGKHNNWSICYDGRNLLNPGSDPQENALFLTVLGAVIRAVDLHSDMLRAATASAGNDHRLGSNEAPPAVISIFLGDQLTEVIKQIEAGTVKSAQKRGMLKIGVDALPPLPRDATDRNRTSPFAFTGNKFEFRAPGSSQSCAGISVVLNTIVAESLDYLSDKIENFGKSDFNASLQKLLASLIKKHKRIIFNGNGYDNAWREEASKRGLPEYRNTPAALERLKDDGNITLFERYGVLTRPEMLSRYEIFMEEYDRKVTIEGKLSLLMARTVIMPPASRELRGILDALAHERKGDAGYRQMRNASDRIGRLLDTLDDHCNDLEKCLKKGRSVDVVAAMALVRKDVDELEWIVADDVWPLPKYREMLFIY